MGAVNETDFWVHQGSLGFHSLLRRREEMQVVSSTYAQICVVVVMLVTMR